MAPTVVVAVAVVPTVVVVVVVTVTVGATAGAGLVGMATLMAGLRWLRVEFRFGDGSEWTI